MSEGKIMQLLLIICLSISQLTYANDEFKSKYDEIEGEKPSLEVFEYAMAGYNQIIESHTTKEIITIIDFSLPSSEKRLWVIDLKNNQTLFFTHVAHGKNTGNLFATHFSNDKNKRRFKKVTKRQNA